MSTHRSARSLKANMWLHYRKQNELLTDLFSPGAQRRGAQHTTKQQEREEMKTTNKMKQTKAEMFIMCTNYITCRNKGRALQENGFVTQYFCLF